MLAAPSGVSFYGVTDVACPSSLCKVRPFLRQYDVSEVPLTSNILFRESAILSGKHDCRCLVLAGAHLAALRTATLPSMKPLKQDAVQCLVV